MSKSSHPPTSSYYSRLKSKFLQSPTSLSFLFHAFVQPKSQQVNREEFVQATWKKGGGELEKEGLVLLIRHPSLPLILFLPLIDFTPFRGSLFPLVHSGCCKRPICDSILISANRSIALCVGATASLLSMFGSSSRTDTVEILKEKMDQLISKETDINCQLQREEMQFGKKRKREVDRWLTIAETKKQAVPVLVEKMKANWLSNFSAEKEAGNMIMEVEELLEQGNRFSDQELVLDDIEQFRGLQLIAPELKDKSSKMILKGIRFALINENALRVGIYGVGGVGKTTLALHINNEMRNDSHFCHVYWVTVSRETSIYKLQSDISKAMGFTIDRENDERKRASYIYMMLKKREKSLLILDDVWENISMDDIGIPIEKGVCKLLITTRLQSVCDAMHCKRIMVSQLFEEEAWDLFVDQLGCYDTLSEEVKKIAKFVAEECDGLPLGIKVMATCMRGVEKIYEWRDTLKNLQESIVPFPEMQDKVFRVLYLSYAQLKDVRLERCFLYCALYPEDYRIETGHLSDYFRAEKLVDITGSICEQDDQCRTLLSRLSRACLLEDFGGSYKMHDLVRDMAVGIMKKEGAIIKAGMHIKEIPSKDLWSSGLTRVSLMNNGIDSVEPHASPDCPSLTVLLLQENPVRRISDYFFVNMKSLQILDLSETQIESLPDSISELGNLRALILRNCLELKYIPSLAKLQNLLELCLRNCRSITELPEGMENMRQLTLLDLAGCFSLESFPVCLFSWLTNLVQLALPISLSINPEELKNIKHLKNFEGHISGSLRSVRSICDFKNFEGHISGNPSFRTREVPILCSFRRRGVSVLSAGFHPSFRTRGVPEEWAV